MSTEQPYVLLAGEYPANDVAAVGGRSTPDGNTELPAAYFSQMAQRDDLRVVVGELTRPGVRLLCFKLYSDIKAYDAGDKDAFMTNGIIRVPPTGFPFAVLIVPNKLAWRLDELAVKCHLTFSKSQPKMAGNSFPIEGVYSLESSSDSPLTALLAQGPEAFSAGMQKLLEDEGNEIAKLAGDRVNVTTGVANV